MICALGDVALFRRIFVLIARTRRPLEFSGPAIPHILISD